ncbi:hypothetical protein B0A55_02205 [Friedmanniomyces simplex]|uniref:Asparagine synthetase domain-containing protein n=1 Tax=Friedmanniomyces simplex TaxID=329884 RepID=A0A4V5NJF8_9PEZI|nr:hypothetical protein B0A55_02205 [Friedmanniomyces simplex]
MTAKALARITGPYALVYHDSSNDILYLGRDFLGRRSLLIKTTVDGALLISSVAGPVSGQEETPWSEVEADGLYYIDLASSHASLHQTPTVKKTPANATSTSHLAVLFSGGLDCTVLARMAHDIYPVHESIDLLNVAFENPRIHKARPSGTTNAYELCPDRITGRASHAELIRVCSERNWVFIAINVPYTETMAHRQTVIDLMHPHNTEMDLSISYAQYFASRGTGLASSSLDMIEPAMMTTTTAKVLLSGLGADELFGGYQRHATAFNRNGFTGLLDELDLDIGRLGKRNLGRDDRVISNWGREARLPFLDEGLLAWAMAATVTEKCGFGETEADEGEMKEESELLEPGKKVLRCLAWRLGMKQVAKEKKRAVSKIHHFASEREPDDRTDTIRGANGKDGDGQDEGHPAFDLRSSPQHSKHLIAASDEYAKNFDQGHLPSPPAKKYLIVTCMDARIDTTAAFGISLGDAHVIRNAGGNAKDAYRSILISQHLLGTTEILLVKHTKCGMLTFSNEEARKIVNGHQGKEVCGPEFDFQPFGDLEEGVRGDVEWLRGNGGVLEGAVVSGWVYGVEDGRVRQVV